MGLTNQVQPEYLENQIQKFGTGHLSDRELFYLLVSYFGSKRSAQQITQKFFNDNYDLAHLEYLTLADWIRYFKNPARANQMMVICEFAKRYRKTLPLKLGQIGSSKMIGEYMIEKLHQSQQEILYGVFLNTKNEIICEKEIFKGTLDSATVHPREIFRIAIQYAAARVIVAHNHPSGNPQPSKNDQRLTDRLVKCGELLGIEFLDHIVIGNQDYFSFREAQLI